MIKASHIKERMEVKGSDGKHVGTVLGVEERRVRLASGGMDHYIDIAMVDVITPGCSTAICQPSVVSAIAPPLRWLMPHANGLLSGLSQKEPAVFALAIPCQQ